MPRKKGNRRIPGNAGARGRVSQERALRAETKYSNAVDEYNRQGEAHEESINIVRVQRNAYEKDLGEAKRTHLAFAKSAETHTTDLETARAALRARPPLSPGQTWERAPASTWAPAGG